MLRSLINYSWEIGDFLLLFSTAQTQSLCVSGGAGVKQHRSSFLNKRSKEKGFFLRGYHPSHPRWLLHDSLLLIFPLQCYGCCFNSSCQSGFPSPLLSCSLIIKGYGFMTVVGWLQPAAEHPQSSSLGSSLGRMRERLGRPKKEKKKIMDQDKDCLIS